jgi:diguanylate cyclase (GGDEF)-like protein
MGWPSRSTLPSAFRGGRLVSEVLRQWWRQPDHFRWLSAYLQERGLQGWLRVLVGGATFTFGVIPFVMAWQAEPSPGIVICITTAILAIACTVVSLMWLTRWPTRTQSAAFVLLAIPTMAAVYLTEHDPVVGLLSCAAFASMGGYVSFFHNARYMLFNLGVADLTAVALAAQVAANGQLLLALSKLILVLTVIATVPLTAQVLVHFLRADLEVSDTDPLTGLLNRRALKRAILDLLVVEYRGSDSDRRVVVAMIDLDNFKRLNDSDGHAAGDRALVAVGALIKENCRDCAVVARAGGEEFLVVDVLSEADTHVMAEGLRASIADSPFRITASVGTACATLHNPSPLVGVYVVEELMTVADEAMYEAKRAGGDQVRHRRDVSGSETSVE